MGDENEKYRILIVDDVPRNLQILGTVLKEEGYLVAFAKNGEEALEYISRNKPDLVMLDIMMPGINGYEVCKRLKREKETMNIPVIFISALSDADDEYFGFEIGGVDYISKPFHPIIVKARVKTHLQLKRKNDLLESLTAVDSLTEIPNRRRFDEVIVNEWNRSKRSLCHLSMILLDIDFFKNYNDQYGHTKGDACLKKVALTIRRTIHRPADFAGRYGGEEFAVILPDTDIDSAVGIAEKIRLNVRMLHIPHKENRADNVVTISLGVASIIPNSDMTHVDLVNAADKYLYEAKDQGKNRVCFHEHPLHDLRSFK